MEGHQCDNEEKKRAQNRQAQRLYRQRMKEKVRMLQAKVDALELHANETQQLSPIQSQSSQSPSVDISGSDLKSLDDILGYHIGSPTIHVSPQLGWQASGEGSSESQRDPFAKYSEHRNVTEAFHTPLPCLTSLLGSLQHTSGAGTMGFHPVASIIGSSTANHTPSPCPVYESNTSKHSTQEPEFQKKTDGIGSSRTLSAVLGAALSPEPRAVSVEDRINLVIAQARTAGYCDLDSAWHEYYTAALPTGSALGIEQRLSRNRRLPGVIASLSRSAQSWSAWERTGFQEELVNSAEAVLVNECRSFRQSVHYDTWHQAWLDGEDLGDDSLSIFQEQLPNLAALVTSLTSNDSIRSPAKAKRLMAAICFDCL